MATGLIEHLAKKLILKRFTFDYNGAISAGVAKRLLPGEAGYTIPTGYIPVGFTFFTTGSGNLVLDYLSPQNNSGQTTDYFIAVKNVHSSSSVSSSTEATVDVLFAPEWMVEIINSDETVKPSGDIMREPVFKVKNFTSGYSISSGGAKAFTRSDFGFFVPEGYEIFGLQNISSGGYRVSVSDCDPFSPSRMMTIRNTYSSAVNNTTANLGVVFINRKFMLPDTRKGLIIYFNEPTGYSSSTGFKIINPSNFAESVTNGDQIFPDAYFHHDQVITFRADNVGIYNIPSKVEIISGGEYISFVDSTCNKFIITEDWTNRQIILKFTFN